MDGETEYLTRSEFAAQQGWRPSYITKLGHQNRLVLSEDGKLVNVRATLAILQRTEDPGKESVRMHHAAQRTEKHVGAHTRANSKTDDAAAPVADPQYWNNKARREGMLADLAELELAKKRGELVERDKVEAAAFSSGRMLRDAVFGILPQIAPELAAMTDPFEIEMRLKEGIRKVFADQARLQVSDITKAMEQPH